MLLFFYDLIYFLLIFLLIQQGKKVAILGQISENLNSWLN